MSITVRAIRGATTLDVDEARHLTERVQELVREIFERNGLNGDDVISIIFTATADITSKFPAAAAREIGMDDVPLLGAQELSVDGMLPRCIRVLMHVATSRPRSEISHVFLHQAQLLRKDLVG